MLLYKQIVSIEKEDVMTPQQAESIPVDEIVDRGNKWYAQLSTALEKEHWGEFVAIRIDTGEYVIHPDEYAIGDEFEKAFGDIQGFVRKIGEQLRLFG